MRGTEGKPPNHVEGRAQVPLKLLFPVHNHQFAGTYYRAMPMAVQLARRGHQVTLLCLGVRPRGSLSPRENPYMPRWTVDCGVRLGLMPNFGSQRYEGYGPLDLFWRTVATLSTRWDLIHIFDHKPNASWPGILGRLTRTPVISDWGDWWGGPTGINGSKHRFPLVAKFEDWWEIRSKQWADGVVTVSTVLRDRAIACGCRADRVLYLPTGADAQRIHPTDKSVERGRRGVPQERKLVGFIGHSQHDLRLVMQELTRLPDVHLMVVGPKKPEIGEMARTFGLVERVWNTGFVDEADVSSYLGCADVLVLPLAATDANRGRLPIKLLDYMCAGRPVVTNPVGDMEGIVADHGFGLVTAPEDMADAFERLLSDPRRCVEMGARARKTAESAFHWDPLITKLEAFYHAVARI